MLIALIKANDGILNSLLLDRIANIMELTMQDIKENPEKWNKSFVHPRLLEMLDKNVKQYLELEPIKSN
jgi:hypothetical protein